VTRGGKSTLCHHLQQHFLTDSVIVEMDQYYWVGRVISSFMLWELRQISTLISDISGWDWCRIVRNSSVISGKLRQLS